MWGRRRALGQEHSFSQLTTLVSCLDWVGRERGQSVISLVAGCPFSHQLQHDPTLCQEGPLVTTVAGKERGILASPLQLPLSPPLPGRKGTHLIGTFVGYCRTFCSALLSAFLLETAVPKKTSPHLLIHGQALDLLCSKWPQDLVSTPLGF